MVRKNAAMNAKAHEFTQLIWSGSETVAFGIKGPWVVAWYCPAGNKPAGNADAYKANVKRTCIENGVNVCYNRSALKAHNAKRLLHDDTPPLATYEAAAKAIQDEMDKPGFNGQMPAESARPKDFVDCAQSIFTEASTDAAKIG
jgi:hypothetical protein